MFSGSKISGSASIPVSRENEINEENSFQEAWLLALLARRCRATAFSAIQSILPVE